MINIQSIIFERNDTSLMININNQSRVIYKDFSILIDNELVLEYLNHLFRIIESWQENYINTKIIDGDSWKLSIIFEEGIKKEYSGKSKFPTNFEALERLNQKIIYEVQNG